MLQKTIDTAKAVAHLPIQLMKRAGVKDKWVIPALAFKFAVSAILVFGLFDKKKAK